jgi:putative membrane protein
MDRFALRWLINALAMYLAVGTGWLPGVHAENTSVWAILIIALIFTLVHLLLSPLLKVLTCSLILVTFGFFILVINTFLFWLTGWIGNQFPTAIGYSVDGFWPAFLGALLVSVVNIGLSFLLRDELKRERDRS